MIAIIAAHIVLNLRPEAVFYQLVVHFNSMRLDSLTILALVFVLASCSPNLDKKNEEPASAPAAQATLMLETVSVSPGEGSGSHAVFSIKEKLASGAAPIAVGLLINSEVSGASACYVYLDSTSKGVLLVNDTGIGSKPLGKEEKLENTQCSVLRDQTSVDVLGSEISGKINIAFKPGFSGPKKILLIANDAQGRNTGLNQAGSWTVTQ